MSSPSDILDYRRTTMTTATKIPKLPKLTPLEALEQAAECLKTLAHPHRLRMVQMLLRGRYTVGELAEACGKLSHRVAAPQEHLHGGRACRGMWHPEPHGLRTLAAHAA